MTGDRPRLGMNPELIQFLDDENSFCAMNALRYAEAHKEPIYPNPEVGVSIDELDDDGVARLATVACGICEIDYKALVDEGDVPYWINNQLPDGRYISTISHGEGEVCRWRTLYTPDEVFDWED